VPSGDLRYRKTCLVELSQHIHHPGAPLALDVHQRIPGIDQCGAGSDQRIRQSHRAGKANLELAFAKAANQGALVLDKAENLLRLEQAMKDDTDALSHTIAGEVSLCMPSSMHWVVTAPMASVAATKFPDIRLRLLDGFDPVLHEQLKSRLADLGVIVYEPDLILDGVDCRPVATEQLCLVGSGPPTIPPGPVHLAKIAGLPLILPSRRNGLRRRLDAAFRRAHLSPDIIEADSYQSMTDLIHQRRAYSIRPSCFVAHGREGQYWWSPIKNWGITWAIAVQEARAHSPAVAAVAELLRQHIHSWIGGSKLVHVFPD